MVHMYPYPYVAYLSTLVGGWHGGVGVWTEDNIKFINNGGVRTDTDTEYTNSVHTYIHTWYIIYMGPTKILRQGRKAPTIPHLN